ncbi:hypothetical protein GLOIN_2v1870636 [Rhizophagus irregularis DAOM 181602=DAOM 197198]|nr:hypothetical protein GLOIN_2v1870636 [Rhizophagus irregularis DAOM 181602=DAOM 197198]
MEEGSSGLPKIGKRRTKVYLECLKYLPKNGKNQDSFRVGFQRTENSKIRKDVKYHSFGLKWVLRFLFGLAMTMKRFISGLGWVSEEWKKKAKIRKYIRILTDWLYFLDMKIADDVSSQDTENVDDNASASTSYTETRTGPDYDNILTSTPHTEGPFVLVVPDEIFKSSTSNNPTKSIKSGKPKKNRGRSLTPIVGNNSTRNLENSPTKPDDDSNRRIFTPIRAPTPIRASTPITPMQIDDEYCNFEERDERYLTIEKFNYTMKLLDEKITSIYRLYQRISEQQRLDS